MIELLDYKIEHILQDKKHKVYLVTGLDDGKFYIYKDFCGDEESLKKEVTCLQYLRSFNYPRPDLVEVLEGGIVKEFIEGKTLAAKLRRQEEIIEGGERYVTDSNFKIIIGLLEWLNHFYRYTYHITGHETVLNDIQLENFIVGRHSTCIDFGSFGPGERESDGSKLISEVLALNPNINPWRIFFARQLYFFMVNSYGYDRSKMNLYMRQNIENLRLNENESIEKLHNSIVQGFF